MNAGKPSESAAPFEVVEGHRLSPCAQLPSSNHGSRFDDPPVMLIIHYTGGASFENACGWLRNKASAASAHLVIGKDARIAQLVRFDRIAWHAGESQIVIDGKRMTRLNKHSLGIELDNPGVCSPHGSRFKSVAGMHAADDVIRSVSRSTKRDRYWVCYPEAQINALSAVIDALSDEYPSLKYVVGHEDVAPGRKSDPGPAFPWFDLRARHPGLYFPAAPLDPRDAAPNT